jgi:acetyl esterase/lipase
MSNDGDFEWLYSVKISGDRIEAEKIQNGKSWIENAKEARIKEWAEMLKDMHPVDLWEKGAPGFKPEYGQRQPAIMLYPGKREGAPRGAVLISAGGGFMFKSCWEAKPVAEKFFEYGLVTFIMDYRVQPYEMKYSEMDVMRAIRYIRSHAAEFNVKPDKIAALGGSAGGMLSAAAAAKGGSGDPASADPVERASSRPDVVVLSYGAYSPPGLINSLGNPCDYRAQQKISAESAGHNLKAGAPPFFIWQTAADDPRHACNFASALAARGIPFELHIFPEGPHGCGLADGKHRFAPYCRGTVRWSRMAYEFLENCGF